ncbi:MAG TPA: TIGR03086 family metal-binding protein [Frankiaceae bacterium]|nr:TIGR03086 family metal-binding protein [Frankiaceae bacterium]
MAGASETAERYRNVAGQFTERVRAVPADAWDNPAPCEGWVARDVVGHLVGWVPDFLSRWDVELKGGPSAQADPVGAWTRLSDGVQAALDDPQAAVRQADSPMGRRSLQDIVDMIVINDVLIHTWDIARAAGLDETLDPAEVARMSGGFLQMSDEALRSSGQFGPRVEVADDADAQTKLIAFSGRRP